MQCFRRRRLPMGTGTAINRGGVNGSAEWVISVSKELSKELPTKELLTVSLTQSFTVGQMLWQGGLRLAGFLAMDDHIFYT
jgi:hypothetical protein